MWNEQFVDKHGKKKYRYYEKYKDPMTNKWRRVSVVLEKNNKTSQKEAQRMLDKQIDSKLNTMTSYYSDKANTLTLTQALDEWFNQFKLTSDAKPSTIKSYHFIIRLIKNTIDTSILVKKITLPYMQQEFNKINEKNLSKYTMAILISVFKRTIKHVKKHYGISIDFIDDIAIKRVRSNHHKDILELEEITEIIKYLKNKAENSKVFSQKMKYKCIYCFIAVQIMTGLRAGEVSALTLDNISFEDMTIEVNGTIQWIRDSNNHMGIKGTPKTLKSYRVIKIDSKTKFYLKERLNDIEIVKQKMTNYVETDFIFTSIKGTPFYTAYINKALKEACENCKIPKCITTHSLRHTHISLLAQIGIPIKAIMDRVGHSDHKTTLEVYTHVTQKMEKELTTKLENLKF